MLKDGIETEFPGASQRKRRASTRVWLVELHKNLKNNLSSTAIAIILNTVLWIKTFSLFGRVDKKQSMRVYA